MSLSWVFLSWLLPFRGYRPSSTAGMAFSFVFIVYRFTGLQVFTIRFLYFKIGLGLFALLIKRTDENHTEYAGDENKYVAKTNI